MNDAEAAQASAEAAGEREAIVVSSKETDCTYCEGHGYIFVDGSNPALCVKCHGSGIKQTSLLSGESLALTVALAQVKRGEAPTPNIAVVCVLALARIDGRFDYTASDEYRMTDRT